MHQFLGYLGRRRQKLAVQLEANRFRPAQAIKYYILVFFLAAAILLPAGWLSSGSLLTGLLDPLPLVHRSVNLILLPLADRAGLGLSPLPRWYEGAWLIGAVFLAALLLNLWVPRFYCRFVCPLGALLGVLSRFAALAHRPHGGGLHRLPAVRAQLRGRLRARPGGSGSASA